MDEVIRQYLIRDLVSRTAQNVVDAIADYEDPEEFEFLDNPSKVPKHCYLSLSRLLLGVDNHADLPGLITSTPGTGNPDQFGIELMYASEEAAEVAGASPPDQPAGTEYALLKIITRVKDIDSDGSEDNLVRIIDARIRFLIDWKARTKRSDSSGEKLTGELDPTGIDLMLDPEYGVTCHWLKMLTPSNVLDKVSLYRVEFCTIFTP